MRKQRRTAAKRKLLPKPLLKEGFYRYCYGASAQRVIDNLHLDISTTALAKLFTRYGEALGIEDKDKQQVILDSLFPEFLDEQRLEVQVQPDDWYYKGYFPFGEWVKE